MFKYLSIGAAATTIAAVASFQIQSKQDDELINVILISRHGARTPLHITEELNNVF